METSSNMRPEVKRKRRLIPQGNGRRFLM